MCNCIDFPCCGHGREDPNQFLEDKTEEEENFINKTMVQCAICGEYRPKNDKYIRQFGICYLCHEEKENDN